MGLLRTTSATSITDTDSDGRRHEVLGILLAAFTLLTALSLWSYDARGGENWIGPVGEALAGVLATAFGAAAWLVPVELLLGTLGLFRRSMPSMAVGRVASTLVIVLVGCALIHLSLGDQVVFGGHMPGGMIGEVLGEVLRSLLGIAGSYVLGIAIILVTLVLRTSFSIVSGVLRVRKAISGVIDGLKHWSQEGFAAWREAKEVERVEREQAWEESQPRIVDSTLDGTDPDGEPVVFVAGETEPELSAADVDDVYEADESDLGHDPEELKVAPKKAARGKKARATKKGAEADAPAPQAKPAKAKPAKAKPVRVAEGSFGPTIVAPAEQIQKARAIRMEEEALGEYELPPTSLFDASPPQVISVNSDELRQNALRLTEKLEAYGVKGRVDEIHPGPVVTMYEFAPQSGTKISKIAGLSDDLAMALAARKVRIVAPIPGKARVGFELPNDDRQTVYLREVLEDERWRKLKAALPVAFGRDIGGQPVYGDLARMPHLLVAGATGSGKSVGLNVMLCSLLARRTPDEVRMLMIDPKVVELAVFDGIPHMLLPVVTDMKKASLALRWAVDEMERRYQLFANRGARNISSYNGKMEKQLAQDPQPELAEGEEEPKKLPYILVVVDEFADLMMVAAKDVEAAVARLAQKARAAGIHVILATQRPSVDVITGMIKANFPARIGFKVSQREDSKTILGRNGAEHLLGMGDMLMIPPGSGDLHRVHSAYVSEEEVKRLCDHLRAQGRPTYDEKILEPRDESGSGGGAKSDDPVYDKAVACVAQAGYCSISHIQRQLGVGYNKAAKLVERMEKDGVVGPPSGKAGGRREVLVQAM